MEDPTSEISQRFADPTLRSQYALAHLDVLSKLFVDPRILEHALHHGLYAQLSRAIARIVSSTFTIYHHTLTDRAFSVAT